MFLWGGSASRIIGFPYVFLVLGGSGLQNHLFSLGFVGFGRVWPPESLVFLIYITIHKSTNILPPPQMHVFDKQLGGTNATKNRN